GVTRRPVLQRQRTLRANSRTDQRPKPADESRIRELEGKVTSKGRRKKIDRSFPDKIDFLVERESLPAEVEPVLKRLHEYRNETYHRDHHRVEVLRPAVIIYFDAACTVLSALRPQSVGDEGTGPELDRFLKGPKGWHDPFGLPERAASVLREEVGLDLEAVRDALSEHLLGRLDELEGNIQYVEEYFPNSVAGDALRIIQVDDSDIEAIFSNEVLRSRTYPHNANDLMIWRQRAETLLTVAEKHALFTEYAAIEVGFEALERQARTAVERIDQEIQLQVDIYRGK
ncbi:hypothetical protein, partial [Streptomyces sp. NPDC047453]|uniref:hypothetical protein n=1 Tax=Streptomyces sp. NPDC047453 TaxID=3154812 RepID=UPI0033FCDE74